LKAAVALAGLGAALLAPGAASGQVSGTAQAALVHHPVTTSNAAAQRFFDEGLTLVYAFNREEARKRFVRASQADPNLAMAYWGIALAAGPNLNERMSPEDLSTANDALKRAAALEASAQPEERRYIEALELRYPKDPKAKTDSYYAAYRDAMRKLFADFPLDDDAAALSVESAMDVDDWGWTGTVPNGSTAALVATLEAVLRRNQDHVGANHYLVHLLDAPGVAAGAEQSARRLGALPVEPAASHLVHMAGHTDLDLGLFPELLREEREAVGLDQSYAASLSEAPHELVYFKHNLDFYAGGALMLGDATEIKAALDVAREQETATALLMEARLGRWDDIVATPKPARGYEVLTWDYVRVLAYCARKDPAAARAALSGFETAMKASTRQGYLDPLHRLALAQIAAAQGDVPSAEAQLRGALPEMAGTAPEVYAPWFFPAGEWLGWLLLENGDYAGAETAFKADLARTPHNAHVLYGLMRTLGLEGKSAEGRQYAGELAANWRGSVDALSAAEI
jgi:hypothetical protein